MVLVDRKVVRNSKNFSLFSSLNRHFYKTMLLNIYLGELIISRPPWQPNSQKPKDLKKSDKILYSFKLNLNQPAFRISSLKENISNNEYLNTLKRSHTINNVNWFHYSP